MIHTMDDSLHFNFNLPAPPKSGDTLLTAADTERLLLDQLAAAKENPTSALYQLAQFYKTQGQPDKAFTLLRGLLEHVSDLEIKAQIVFTLGQTAETARDYELAVRFYREALAIEPANPFHWYFIHNNLGFSLNALGRFGEAEAYCRRAITIDSGPSNAHKNLGLALVGLERFSEAAEAFIRATQANAADPRSLAHLETLLAEHPEIDFEFANHLTACREAVRIAREEINKIESQWQQYPGKPAP
jgi:tetratricopeptide (TPR) repeat protein